ncbi:BspA family leucine-rich repeat surface protein [Flagellimonas sp.]|uniref:BspA family leucine-rich repeat surface protein n=1 Tax=Flagellimonas sp. TaxID=2058762 RepID=UPI003F4A6041
MIKNYLTTLLLFSFNFIFSQAFVTTWKTDNFGDSANDQIIIPTFPGETYNYNVDWGDGTSDSNVTGDITHTYSSIGTYQVSITGDFPRIYFNFGGDGDKLLTIEQWGNIAWSSMEAAFAACENMDIVATDVPNLSNVSSMRQMFMSCTSLQGNSAFNNWVTGSVTNMSELFSSALIFNQDISNWNTSNVTDMSGMFVMADFFNQPIGSWNTSSVQDMGFMFNMAGSFNQDISNWNVGNVTNMAGMFGLTQVFNQPLNNWDVSKVTDMSSMFADAVEFDQDLGDWDIGQVVTMASMFTNTELSFLNYDTTLNGWASLTTLQRNVQFDAGNSGFCDGETSRQGLIDNFGWTITDNGRNCPFVTTWKTDNPGASSDNQITIPTFPGETYSYSIYWGDGTSDDNVTGDITHTYASPGTYQVSISGDFPRIYFNFFPEGEAKDYEKIISVDEWGTIEWSSMADAFARCSNLDVKAPDVPDLSNVTNMLYMFRGCSSLIGNTSFSNWEVSNVNEMFGVFTDTPLFNQNIGGWNVSNVSDMGAMFLGASSFNQNIGGWNVSNVTRMVNMFSGAISFNQDIGGWNVSMVDDMAYMFRTANSFNQNIDGWNVSNVVRMEGMFLGNATFNQPLGSWQLTRAENTALMFFDAQSFNQDLSTWDVSGITDMDSMFFNASSFDQDLGSWDVSNVTNLEFFLTGTALSTLNYDKLLKGWGGLPSLQSNLSFSAGDAQYCASGLERQTIIDTYGWSITDGGSNSECLFVTVWKTDNPGGSADNQIAIPTFPGETYNYTIDWGDGMVDTSVTGDIAHTYAIPGTYKVSISGDFPRMYFFGSTWADDSPLDNKKLIAVEKWGLIEWTSMEFAFLNCTEMQVTALDTPLLDTATNLNSMFNGCYAMTGATSFAEWDVSNIEQMSGVFADCFRFDQDISSWEVNNVRDMSFMFSTAQDFNADIGGWNVSNVESMRAMFQDASSFNQNLNSWDVSNVTDMLNMFFGASTFNQNIRSWNVGKVNTMNAMFANATSFNQNIGNWNVSLVTDMAFMFFEASSFDQNLGNWDIEVVSDISNMFTGASLSIDAYDAILRGWSTQSLTNGLTFDAGTSFFCEATSERQFIIDTYGWIINDEGEAPLCNEDNDNDGIFDHKDDCLNTLPGVAVNENGCDSIPNDAIQVNVSTPSCVGSTDGTIEVRTNISGYLLNILVEGNGASNEFLEIDSDTDFEVNDLSVGSYLVTISIPDILFERTFGVSVNGIDVVSARRSQFNSDQRKVSYTVSGSKTYSISINGQNTNYTFEDTGPQTITLENLIGQNEVVISGESDCQGKITDSFFIGGDIQIYPTISESYINLLTSSNKLNIRIYSLGGRLVRNLEFNQRQNSLDISSLESGIYIFQIITDKGLEENLKIVKR